MAAKKTQKANTSSCSTTAAQRAAAARAPEDRRAPLPRDADAEEDSEGITPTANLNHQDLASLVSKDRVKVDGKLKKNRAMLLKCMEDLKDMSKQQTAVTQRVEELEAAMESMKEKGEEEDNIGDFFHCVCVSIVLNCHLPSEMPSKKSKKNSAQDFTGIPQIPSRRLPLFVWCFCELCQTSRILDVLLSLGNA